MTTNGANPLLLEWLKEMYDVAKERNSKGVTTYVGTHSEYRKASLILAGTRGLMSP